jgi:hypothetical protein
MGFSTPYFLSISNAVLEREVIVRESASRLPEKTETSITPRS